MKKVLPILKKIERMAYPEFMWSINDCRNIRDLADYCECHPNELFILCGEDWYLLAAEREDEVEVVDLASINGMGFEIIKVIKTCLNRWQGKTVTMDCRASTSYPILLKIVQRYGYDYTDEVWYWEDEEMHAITVRL